MATILGDFIPAEDEVMVICPYNEAHTITNLRLGVHLTKCRKEYEKNCQRLGKSMDMRNCRFNDKHVVPGPEIKLHESKCQDAHAVIGTLLYHQSAEFKRTLAEEEARRQAQERELRAQPKPKDKIVWGKPQKYPAPPPPAPFSAWGEAAEDWESDAKSGYEAAYDPEERMKIDGSLYQPRGLSKSERKKYRAEQKVLASQRETSSTDLRDMKETFAKFGLIEDKKNIQLIPESRDPGSSPSKRSGLEAGLFTISESKREYKKEVKVSYTEEDDEYFGDDPFA